MARCSVTIKTGIDGREYLVFTSTIHALTLGDVLNIATHSVSSPHNAIDVQQLLQALGKGSYNLKRDS